MVPLAAESAWIARPIRFLVHAGHLSLRRAKQFALIHPSAGARLDLGLILKSKPPQGRLEASGSFNAMFTCGFRRVRLSDPSEINEDLLGWLREAYDEAR